MNYVEAKEISICLNNKVDELSEELNRFNKYKNDIGLIPTAVKETGEYKTLDSNFKKAFKELQEFNKWYTKTFKKEINKDRISKRVIK